MNEAMTLVAMASFSLIALTIAALAGLKGWNGWLELKRFELAGGQTQRRPSPAIERIEIADLKERIRKLESIAACVDL